MRIDKAMKRLENSIRDELIPGLKASAAVIQIAPDAMASDWKMALEIGYAILLNKPLIVVIPKGRIVSPRFRQIADHVIEAHDIDSSDGRLAIHEAIMAAIQKIEGKPEGKPS